MSTEPVRRTRDWIRHVGSYAGIALSEDRVQRLADAAGPVLSAVEALSVLDLKDREPAVTFRLRPPRPSGEG